MVEVRQLCLIKCLTLSDYGSVGSIILTGKVDVDIHDHLVMNQMNT